MSQWYAVRTATRREFAALAGLLERKFAVFMPMQTRWSALWRGRREPVSSPLLPGYLFVLCELDGPVRLSPGVTTTQARLILDTEGVSCFVEATGADGIDRPIAFPHKDVHRFQAEERAGVFDYTKVRRAAYRPKKGARVRIHAGAYYGYFAKVLATPKGERAHVMTEGPGARGVTVDVKNLSAA